MNFHTRVFDHCSVEIRQSVVGHQSLDIAQAAKSGEGQPAELGMVGHQDHLLTASHHLTFGLDQKQIRVVNTFRHDPPRTEDGLTDPDVQHGRDRQRSQRDTGSRIDVTPDQDEIDTGTGR